jgi:hypothetical protein
MALLTGLGRSRPAPARICAAAIALLGGALLPAWAAGQTAALEYAVKASFLYKLGPFIGWPPQAFASSAASFNVCVVGADPFGAALDRAVQGQTIDGRPIAIRRMMTVTRGSGCQVVYFGSAPPQSRAEALDALRGAPVLTVTDERNGGAGGLVHFVLRDGRVRFGVDALRAKACGLTVSSKLLSLAVPLSSAGGA